MYSYGPPHMAAQKQDDQLEHTYSSYVRIRDVALKTYQRRRTIGRSGERGSGISVLATRHDDDDSKDSIWSIERTLISTTSQGQSEPGNNSNEGYSRFPKAPKVEPQHQMQFSFLSRTLDGDGSVTPLQKYSRRMLPLKLTGLWNQRLFFWSSKILYGIHIEDWEDKLTILLLELSINLGSHSSKSLMNPEILCNKN